MRKIVGGFALLFGIASIAGAQVTLNMSHDLVSLGIASTNMVPSQPALDAGPLLSQAVAYAKQNQIDRVTADPGAYYFLSLNGNTHVQLSDVANMTIDFQGADLIFTHPLFYGIVLSTSTSVVLQNFTADYQPLPFTQVRVVAVDNAKLEIQYAVEPGWQDPSAFNLAQVQPGAAEPDIGVHIFRNGQPALGTKRMQTQRPFKGNRFPLVVCNSCSAAPNLTNVRVGDVVVLAMRVGGDTINTNHCSGCTLRNITVYSGAGGGAGVQAHATQSSLMERVYAIPKPGTDRLVSTWSAIAIGASGPNNQIRLSRGIRTMDDSFWFYVQPVGTVQNQNNNRSLTVEGTGNSSLGEGDSVPNGFPVTFQRQVDGLILGSAVIVSQVAPATFFQPYRVIFNFDRDLPANLVGAVMYTTDASHDGANSLIERSAAENSSVSSRGTYVAGLANSAVRGNYIRHTSLSGIFGVQGMTPGDPPSPPLVDLNVANNVVDGTNLTSEWWWYQFGGIQTVTIRLDQNGILDLMPTSPHQNIGVINNFIANPGRSAVWLGNMTGGNVSGNYFLNPNDHPDVANSYPGRSTGPLVPLVIDTTSSGVTTSSNTIDQTSGRMWVTDTQFRELAAYAPGSTIRLNAFNLGTLASPSLTLTDADGVSRAASIQNTTTHALDIQVPFSGALGGAYITLTAGGQKFFGTLFIDSQDNIPAVNGCVYETSLSSNTVPAASNSVSILVVTQAGCAYSVTADPFVTLSGATSGTGVVVASFTPNIGAERSANLEVAGLPVALSQSATTLPLITSVANATGYQTKITPGSVFGVFGINLGPANIVLASAPNYLSSLAGTSVTLTPVGGGSVITARIYYSLNIAVAGLLPSTIPLGTYEVRVTYNGQTSDPMNVAVVARSFGIATADSSGTGPAQATNGAVNGGISLVRYTSGSVSFGGFTWVLGPAHPGDILMLCGTGGGADLANDAGGSSGDQTAAGNFFVTVGTRQIVPLYAGTSSGYPGLWQINFQLPLNLSPGCSRSVQVSAGGELSNQTTIAVAAAGETSCPNAPQ